MRRKVGTFLGPLKSPAREWSNGNAVRTVIESLYKGPVLKSISEVHRLGCSPEACDQWCKVFE